MNSVFKGQPTSIFERMSGLARQHNAVNLGQGFPDFGWPEDVLEEAAKAVIRRSNQYAPMRGLPELREAVARHYRRYQDVSLTPENITITSGATEALASSIFALVEPGDEVVLFQPLYDAYLPLVLRAGGIPKFVRLTPPDWRITEEALQGAFSERTKLVLFNNPHNPTARLFDESELRLLADACRGTEALVLCDEVWEHIVFDGRRIIPFSTIPGMADCVIKIGSAGKIFSLTGWKVGWIAAPDALAMQISKAHQFVTFSTAPNLQSAVAYGLGKTDDYFDGMRALFSRARDEMSDGLSAAGFAVLPVEGTYFLSVDLNASGISVDDQSFCERAVIESGVAAIPVSSFYAEDPVRNVIRLCFAKKRETIDLGLERMHSTRKLFA